jgi:hypothetical protein
MFYHEGEKGEKVKEGRKRRRNFTTDDTDQHGQNINLKLKVRVCPFGPWFQLLILFRLLRLGG